MTTIDPQLFGFAACRVDCLWILLHAFIVVHRSLVAEVVPLRCQGKRGWRSGSLCAAFARTAGFARHSAHFLAVLASGVDRLWP